MAGSTIVTRGYGGQSAIITQGYGLLSAINEAIERIIPRIRFIKGKSSYYYIPPQYEEQPTVMRVTVELVGLHEEHLINAMKNEICITLDKNNVHVAVSDIEVVPNEDTTSVIINNISIAPIKRSLKVIAKLGK